MVARRSLLVLALALAVVRCTDHPAAGPHTPMAPQALRWSPSVQPHFSAISSGASGNGGTLFATPPLGLDQYSVSFWAVRGEARSVQINYQNAIDDATHPFLNLTVSDPVFVPGVGELAMGDSVLVTVAIDTVRLAVSLEPSGLQFGTPSRLQIWYGGAGGDLNGDGIVDSTDTYVEHQLLGLWYREGNSPWAPVPVAHSLDDKSFISDLPHFSEWELCWVEDFLDWAVAW